MAPWSSDKDAKIDLVRYLTRTVQVSATAFRGLAPFDCLSPRYEPTAVPPEGLFQGNLPAPAAAAARALGMAPGVVHGLQLSCATGDFEFHLVDPLHLMVAIDNVIWTLDRSPGALAAPTSAEGVVQALLERHFAGSMSFDSALIQRLSPFLSSVLTSRIGRYLATSVRADKVPAIEGDPFTGMQAHPTRFSVPRAMSTGTGTVVAVRFSDDHASRTVRYLMRADPSGWRVDDLGYDDGRALTDQLPVPTVIAPVSETDIPAWAQVAWRTASRTYGLALDSAVAPPVQMADFDGDGRPDVAWLVRRRATRSPGVLIVHASGRAAQLCGAGVPFGNGGDNFDWMDHWQIVPRRGGAGSALLVEKTESASGRIEFRAGRYRWLQVGD
jgi:hypothetical protein